MKPAVRAEAERVLGEVLRAPRDRRDEVLRAICPDAAVRSEVMRLLGRRDTEEAFFATPTVRAPIPETPSVTVGPDGHVGARTASVDASAEPAPPIAPGTVLAGRYEILERLGAGTFGTVHRARDRLTGRPVAVKVLTPSASSDPHGLRREVAILRRARLPGLVEMLDDGIDQDRAFLVMRLVDGRPFPGRPSALPAPWTEVAPRAIALVEALGRLHWLGVLHRDVKPENVLVAADGSVTIVDLGIARRVDGFGDAWQGYLVGTPAYLAPERTTGAPATVRSDLYAAGVMLYEALSGRLPRVFRDFPEMVRERATPAPPLRTVAPGVPEHVARTIDAMIDVLPERRPRSARLAAAMLRGQGEHEAVVRLPRLGSSTAVDAIVGAVHVRRAADVGGAKGAGRTRVLDEAERRLAAEGYRVLRTRPSAEPFGSLVAALGGLPAEPGWTLADLRNWLTRCLRFWLRANVAVFADDWAGLDAESRDALLAVRAEGAVIRVVDGAPEGAVVPPPLTETDLRSLFRGPDRIFHLREDGAKELWRRTSGHAGDVVREIETWIEGGIARWEEDRIVLDRAGIERLETRVSPSLRRSAVEHEALPASCTDVAAVLEVAACPVPADAVAGLLGVPAWKLEADLELLRASGVVRRHPEGTVEAVQSLDAAAGWSGERRRAAHAAIAGALPPATERRLFHLLACGDFHRYASEAADVAQRRLDEGNAERSLALLAEMVSAMNRTDAVPEPRVDAAAWLLLDTALALATPAALDHVAAEFERGRHVTDAWQTCTRICEAAGVALRGDPRRALETIRTLPVQESPRHRLRILSVRAMASRLAEDRETELDTVREGARLARSHHAEEARACFQDWLGWMRYRQLRFGRAAALHGRAARRRRTLRGRAIAMTNAASCCLQHADLGAAREWARRAERVASRARIPLAEARAAWLLRRVAWRNGTATAVDEDLVEAIRDRLEPNLEAIICMQEATIALHLGRARAAWDLATRSRTLAESVGRRALVAIADGVVAASGGETAWQAAARAFPAGIALLPAPTGIEIAAICAPFVPSPHAGDLRRAIECARAEQPPGAAAHDICRDDEVVARLESRETGA